MNKTKNLNKKNIPHSWMTPTEIEREKKHDSICREFSNLRNIHPDVSAYRLFAAIGERVGMTSMGVMRVLQRHKLYTVHRSR